MEGNKNQELHSNQLEIAKKLLKNAVKDPRLSKYINDELIEEALSKVYIAKSVDEYWQKVQEGFIKEKEQCKDEINLSEINEEEYRMLRGICFGGNIVINFSENPDKLYETIIHEVVHYLSNQTGIKEIGEELAKEDSNWQGVKQAHLITLDESITQYITRIISGKDTKMQSSYDYGVDILEEYIKATNGQGDGNNNILEAYFNKNKDALKQVASDFNMVGDRLWQDILKSCLAYDVAMTESKFYFLKHCMKSEEIDKHMQKISEMYAARKQPDGEEVVVTEEKYAQIYKEEPPMTREEFFRRMREFFVKREDRNNNRYID